MGAMSAGRGAEERGGASKSVGGRAETRTAENRRRATYSGRTTTTA